MVRGVDGQMQCDDGVAAAGVLCPNGVVMDVRGGRIGCLVGKAVFVVGVSCADGSGERDGVHRKDSQNQGGNRVTSVDVLSPNGVVMDGWGHRIGRFVEETVFVVCFTGADRCHERDGVHGLYFQGQDDDGVAAVGIGGADGVVIDVWCGRIGHLVGEAVIVVGVACADGSGEYDGIHRMDVQGQGDDGVATMDIDGADGVVVYIRCDAQRCIIRETVSVVGVPGTEILGEGDGVDREDG